MWCARQRISLGFLQQLKENKINKANMSMSRKHYKFPRAIYFLVPALLLLLGFKGTHSHYALCSSCPPRSRAIASPRHSTVLHWLILVHPHELSSFYFILQYIQISSCVFLLRFFYFFTASPRLSCVVPHRPSDQPPTAGRPH